VDEAEPLRLDDANRVRHDRLARRGGQAEARRPGRERERGLAQLPLQRDRVSETADDEEAVADVAGGAGRRDLDDTELVVDFCWTPSLSGARPTRSMTTRRRREEGARRAAVH
jgi:hypothetical protein